MNTSSNRMAEKDLKTVLDTVVLPAFIQAYKKAEKDGYDVRNAFKSNIEEVAARLDHHLLKAA